MTQHLATKQDLAHSNTLMAQSFETVNQRFEAVKQSFEAVNHRFEAVSQRFNALDKSLDARFAALTNELELTQQNLETRIVVKLGALMPFLFAAAAAGQALFR
jgi:hypothetical protein